MRGKYLLPCSCGREIPVEAAQAGEQVRCTCGAELEVPTLLALATLKRAEPGPAATKPPATWGARQRLILVGAMITAASLGVGIRLYLGRPTIPVEKLSPAQAWALWLDLREDVGQRRQREEQYLELLKQYHGWMGLVGFVAAVGVLTMAGSLLVPKSRSAKRARKVRPASRGRQAPDSA